MVAKREQRTKKNILTASLATKGLVSTQQINQPGCPWQRHNCQVFKFQIRTVWVIKVTSSFYKNTSVACETAGSAQPLVVPAEAGHLGVGCGHLRHIYKEGQPWEQGQLQEDGEPNSVLLCQHLQRKENTVTNTCSNVQTSWDVWF